VVSLPNKTYLIYGGDERHPVLITINGRYWEVLGECNLCGECCESVSSMFSEWKEMTDKTNTCIHLRSETVDGISRKVCSKQWNKPAGCMLYPWNPLDKNHFKNVNCQFSFNEINKKKFLKKLNGLI